MAERLQAKVDHVTVLTTGALVENRYTVERKLGQGGMGAVFLARDVVLDRLVVIKHLLPELALDGHSVARFAREASAAVHLSCAHSARVYGVGKLADGIPYIVMEYLEGRDLDTLIAREGRLTPGRAVALVLQALEGLAEAHAHGIVHRDIKPQNLFITYSPAREEVVKVLDFGLAKAPIGAGEAKLTKTAACMGSPAYMAPEQIREFTTVDSRADIYAIGCCLYECLTGRVPFEADSVADVLVQALTTAPVPPRERCPDIPVALSEVVLRCLEKEAAARYPDVGALARALHDAAVVDAKASRARVDRILARGFEEPTLEIPAESSAIRTVTVSDARPEKAHRFGVVALTAMALFGIAVTLLVQPWTAATTPVHVEAAVAARAAAPPLPVEPLPIVVEPAAAEPAIEIEADAPRARTATKARPAKKSAKAPTAAPPRDPGSHY